MDNQTLDVSFTLDASGLDVGCNGQVKLEFVIEADEFQVILPEVIYSGTERYRYDQRRYALFGYYHTEPYHTYKGVNRKQAYALDYYVSVPYQSWMEHASITCNEYVHDCTGTYQVSDSLLVADLNPAPVYVEPEVWAPDKTLFAELVSFLVPDVEEVKNRASMLSLHIGFPVNVTEVRPDFNNNSHELMRADSLVQSLQSNDIIDINSVSICGYASPEGRYDVNDRLAMGRSRNFKEYLVGKYPDNTYIRNAFISWIAEDWEGFGKMVEQSDIPAKQEVLAIVNDAAVAPDTKDKMLQNLIWWSNNYKIILKEMYPKLRRIELRVDYTVRKLNDNEARELLYTHPDLLSLDEIYRVARYYEPGSRQYREVYEIAARQHPDDVVANSNAAAALLQENNPEAALSYLEKIKGQDASLVNYGAYWYIKGDLEKASAYFNQAKEAGIEQGTWNLRLINPSQK